MELRIAVVGDLRPVSPTPDASTTGLTIEWVFEPLVRARRDGTLAPVLASGFQRISPDRIHLVGVRDNARFSDGSPVQLDDVIGSLALFGLLARRDGAGGLIIESNTGIVADALLIRAVIFKQVASKYYGTGPFFEAEQDPAHLLLKRREPVKGRIDTVLLKAYAAPRDAFAHTLAGDADLLPVTDPKQLEFFSGVPRFKTARGPSPSAIGVAFNVQRLDRDRRRALLAALPATELSALASEGTCAPIATAVARDSLSPGATLNIAVPIYDAVSDRMALAVQRTLGRYGGDIVRDPVEAALRRLQANDFDLMVVRSLIWPPSAVAAWHTRSATNVFGYSNPEVDRAIEAGDWTRAVQALADDPPIDFICRPEQFAVVDSRVKNPEVGPYGLLETLPEWEVEP